MSLLVDTSVWIDHLHEPELKLLPLLHRGDVMMHPLILGEIACGGIPFPRADHLQGLSLFPACLEATLEETLRFVEQEKIYGLGCGIVDLMLLVSTLLTPDGMLWTRDKRLNALAERFGVAYQP